jgi:hypothetical protein
LCLISSIARDYSLEHSVDSNVDQHRRADVSHEKRQGQTAVGDARRRVDVAVVFVVVGDEGVRG